MQDGVQRGYGQSERTRRLAGVRGRHLRAAAAAQSHEGQQVCCTPLKQDISSSGLELHIIVNDTDLFEDALMSAQ